MWSKYKKEIIWVLNVFVFFISATYFTYISVSILANKIPASKFATALQVGDSDYIETNIRIAFVGDIMLDRGVKSLVYTNFGGNYEELFIKVKSQLDSYDFLFGNLEGPISDKGVDGGGIYSFRMEPVALKALKQAGFDGFSIENNHILNYGTEAVEDTKIRLHDTGIDIGGENISLGGVKIIVLTFNQFIGLDFVQMAKDIIDAKKDNDLVITYFHFGDEYMPESNEYQKAVARLSIDVGADLVVGSHPHVVQTLESYNGKYIMYSLGNFIFDQNFSEETMQGGLLEVEVNQNTKLIEKVILKKVLLNSKFQIENII